jgi:ornithine cyclodeaminase
MVSMTEAIAAVREGFIGLARGEFEMPTRTALWDGQFLVMSAHHAPTGTAIVKTLSLAFDGRDPAIVGTVSWNDLESAGQLIADAATVTALRTGAVSGVATDLLARPDAATLTVIGAGAQAADQMRAVCAVRPITMVLVAGRNWDRASALAVAMRAEFPGIEFASSTDIAGSAESADIVCCATTATEPLFPLSALKPNVHINAIGAFRPTMRELADEVLADAGNVYIDETEAILEESGEILHALAAGAIGESQLVELGHALAGEPPVPSGRTVFKSVGIAMQDWAIMRLLASSALSR